MEMPKRLAGTPSRGWSPARLRQGLTVMSGIAVLAIAMMFSLVVLVVVMTGALTMWAYVWWRTRQIRRQDTRSAHVPTPPHVAEMKIIKGEVIRETRPGGGN